MPVVKEGFVQEVIERYEADPGMLIPMMQDLQAEYGYLPPEELKRLAGELRVPLTRVYGVAMFYASFRLAPKGEHEVTLCMGTVCYLKGAPQISEAICTEYGIQPGGTTSDRLFTLQAVNCVGACALAPVMIVDGKYYDGVNPESALKVLRGLAGEPERGVEKAEEAPPAAKEAPPAAKEAPPAAEAPPKAAEPEQAQPQQAVAAGKARAPKAQAKPKARTPVKKKKSTAAKKVKPKAKRSVKPKTKGAKKRSRS